MIREVTAMPVPAGVNSVSAWALEPCTLSTMPVETPVNTPVSPIAWAPTQRPPRDMCS